MPRSEHVAPVRIIGVGNDYRCDDRVGLVAARALQIRGDALPGVMILEQSGEGTDLMACFQDAGTVVLIDAMVSGEAQGTIHRVNAREQPLSPECFRCSTHAFGVAEAIELARALGQLPPRVIVYGIEGERFEPGVELSLPVAVAAQVVVERIMREVRGLLGMEC